MLLHCPQGAVGSGEGSLSAPEVSAGSCVRGFFCLHHSNGISQASGCYIIFLFHLLLYEGALFLAETSDSFGSQVFLSDVVA